MKFASFHFAALAIAAAVCLGCDERDGASRNSVQPIAEFHGAGGSLHGNVMLTGWIAPKFPANPLKCGQHTHQIPNESVVTTSSGTLQNVVVFLKFGPVAFSNSAGPAVLDQVDCVYKPHVLALRAGQTLRVKSSDQTLHNVHVLAEANPGANFGMMQPGFRDLTFKVADRFAVKCDVHPWMLAHVAVFDHPYFCVTGETGSFEIKNIPPGTYDLVAWQERFGEIEERVIIKANETTEFDFVFKPSSNNHQLTTNN